MSWPIVSVRGDGRDQSRTRSCQRLAASLSWNRAKVAKSKGFAKRETAKHVESFGVGFWIRVQFPAPPPIISRQTAGSSRQEAARSNPQTTQIPRIKN